MSENIFNITVVITTYRRSFKIIERALKSVSKQTYPIHEILLVDDNNEGSMFNNDIKIMLSSYPQVKHIQMIKNSGVSKARNRGIKEASGDYIAFLDDDDEWLPEKLKKQVSLFMKDPSLSLVYGVGIEENDETLKTEHSWQWEHFREDLSYEDILRNDYIGPPHVLVKKSVLEEVGGFREYGQPSFEDYELWIRIAKKYHVKGIKEPVYIRHMDSGEHVSATGEKAFLGMRNIYVTHKDDYKKYPASELQILWNICREGFGAKDPRIIPYAFRWLFLKVISGEKRNY